MRHSFCFRLLFSPRRNPSQWWRSDRKEPVAYEKEIEPIFKAKCVACHSGKELKGKFDVGSYATLMKGGQHGPAIVPNKSADSPLVRQTGKVQKPFMPPKDEDPLSPQELCLDQALDRSRREAAGRAE